MKNHRSEDPGNRADAERRLYQAILALETESECRQFLADLCTPAELEAIVDRWAVVPYLQQGLPYRKIHELTGVSVTTIGRVARFLSAGNGGYRIALERLSSQSVESDAGARRIRSGSTRSPNGSSRNPNGSPRNPTRSARSRSGGSRRSVAGSKHGG